MESLSLLEHAVLVAIARQAPDYTDVLMHQLTQAKVVARKNTGTGFCTTLDVSSGDPIHGLSSPIGDVRATVDHLQHGMGFLLWLESGRMHELEGYSYAGESTSDFELERVLFGAVGPYI
jgi:hypothetical protein